MLKIKLDIIYIYTYTYIVYNIYMYILYLCSKVHIYNLNLYIYTIQDGGCFHIKLPTSHGGRQHLLGCCHDVVSWEIKIDG